MIIKKEFGKAKDFRGFLEQNSADFSQMYVKEVYNLGDSRGEDSPLFIYSGYSVFMAYLSEKALSLSIYEKDFFIRHIRAGFFCEDPASAEFYRFSFTDSKLINSFVQDIDILEHEDGTIKKVVLMLKNGQQLHLEHGVSVPGTMSSSLTD